MSFGPNPWQQTSWDWRAAGNFIGGGIGTGLILACAVFAAPVSAWTSNWLLLLALALIGAGLTCVWLEIGRPMRALHVFFNPKTSWMSREAFVGLLLFPCGLLALLGLKGWIWPTTALALIFLYCQSRMLPAARGIVAWRSGVLIPLMFATGLCEGFGAFVLLGGLHGRVTDSVILCFAATLLARSVVWYLYHESVQASLVPRARNALDQAGHLLNSAGTLLPMLLAAVALALSDGMVQTMLLALAGAGAVLTGANLKYTLITRAGFNQGFALTKIPVRGVKAS